MATTESPADTAATLVGNVTPTTGPNDTTTNPTSVEEGGAGQQDQQPGDTIDTTGGTGDTGLPSTTSEAAVEAVVASTAALTNPTGDVAAATAALLPPVLPAGGLTGYPIMFAPQTAAVGGLDASSAVQVMEETPTYVNPKQYHRILKRREKRKKLTGSDVISYTPRKRSYMHESRHRHAVARKRGVGGRFLSKKEEEGNKDKGQEENKEEEGGDGTGTGTGDSVADVLGAEVGGGGEEDGEPGDIGVGDNVADPLADPTNELGK